MSEHNYPTFDTILNKNLFHEFVMEFEVFVSSVIHSWAIYKALKIFPSLNADKITISHDYLESIVNDLSQELSQSIINKFDEDNLPLQVLLEHIAEWVPGFALAQDNSRHIVH